MKRYHLTIVRRRAAVCILLVWTAVAGLTDTRADELRDGAERLLQSAATVPHGSRTEFFGQYRAIKALAPDDPRVDRVWAVVLLKQHQYAEALPVLAGSIRANPADLDSACWYAWGLVQCRRYGDALAAIGHIGRRTADEQLSPLDARLRAAYFLGQLVGYFESVAPGGITPAEVGKVKNDLLSQLQPTLIELLDDGRDQVVERFNTLQGERETRLAERSADTARQQEDARDALDEKRRTAADSETRLKESAERVQDATRQLAVLQRQITSLSQDRALLASQIIATQARITGLTRQVDVEIPGIQGNPNSTTGRIITSRTSRSGIDVADAARAQELSLGLAVLQKQAFDLDRRLLDLTTSANKLQSEGAEQTDTAMQSQATLERAAKRAAALEKQVRRLENEKPASSSVTAQMRSLSTYVPFPYEQQQARALSWFDGK